jgi:hypothetical protein
MRSVTDKIYNNMDKLRSYSFIPKIKSYVGDDAYDTAINTIILGNMGTATVGSIFRQTENNLNKE